MDGQTEVKVFGNSYAIPGPDNPRDPCPFCGPPLPDNATRWMRKGYYLAVRKRATTTTPAAARAQSDLLTHRYFQAAATVSASHSQIVANRIESQVTWIDYLAGQMIGELETLGHKDDTVIALVGDHGWQ